MHEQIERASVCEACYAQTFNPWDEFWDLIFQSWLCPSCMYRAEQDHIALMDIRGGQYAPEERTDPRAGDKSTWESRVVDHN